MLRQEKEMVFREWLTTHMGLVYKVVHAYTDNPEDRDDLAQQILLQLWTSVESFRGDSKVTTWIYRVALNTALVWCRNELKHCGTPIFALRENNSVARDTSQGPERRELIEILYTEIRKLDKVDRSLMLLFLDGLSYRDMAEIMGITESNVGVRLNRARKRLAQTLKGLGHEF